MPWPRPSGLAAHGELVRFRHVVLAVLASRCVRITVVPRDPPDVRQGVIGAGDHGPFSRSSRSTVSTVPVLTSAIVSFWHASTPRTFGAGQSVDAAGCSLAGPRPSRAREVGDGPPGQAHEGRLHHVAQRRSVPVPRLHRSFGGGGPWSTPRCDRSPSPKRVPAESTVETQRFRKGTTMYSCGARSTRAEAPLQHPAPLRPRRGQGDPESRPAPAFVSKSTRPLCRSTTISTVDSPSPVPPPSGLVVTKGSKNWSCASSGMPGPSSETATWTSGRRRGR